MRLRRRAARAGPCRRPRAWPDRCLESRTARRAPRRFLAPPLPQRVDARGVRGGAGGRGEGLRRLGLLLLLRARRFGKRQRHLRRAPGHDLAPGARQREGAVDVFGGCEQAAALRRVDPVGDGARALAGEDSGRRKARQRLREPLELARQHRDDLAFAPALAGAGDAGEYLAQPEHVLLRQLAPALAVSAEPARPRRVALAEVAEDRGAVARGRIGVRDHAGELAAVELAPALPVRRFGSGIALV